MDARMKHITVTGADDSEHGFDVYYRQGIVDTYRVGRLFAEAAGQPLPDLPAVLTLLVDGWNLAADGGNVLPVTEHTFRNVVPTFINRAILAAVLGGTPTS